MLIKLFKLFLTNPTKVTLYNALPFNQIELMKLRVLKSSAGAGKTYNLIKHYLILLLSATDPGYYRHILAITFTNKSTNEMKSRLIDALKGLSLEDSSYEILKSDLESDPRLKDVDISDRCSSILSRLLHDYGDLSISTIDRFVYRLIRSFSYELNIPVNVEIELKKERLQSRIVDSIYEGIETNEDLSRILLEFSIFKFTEEKNTNLDNDLKSLIDEVMSVKGERYLQKLKSFDTQDFLEIRKAIIVEINNFKQSIVGIANEMLNIFEEAGAEPSDLFNGEKGVYGYLKKLSGYGSLKLPGKNVQKVLETGKWISSSCNDTIESNLTPRFDDLTEKLKRIVNTLETGYPSYIFNELLLNQVYSMALAHEVQSKIIEIKRLTSTAQLEDFNKLISKLVSETPIPFIYERIGGKFHHYLIDEFQDTSEVQWFNLIPLIENGLAEGYDSLIVGDAKQAIYRWRGGEAMQLTRLPELAFSELVDEQLEVRQESFNQAFETIRLEHNFRSSRVVVEFVNAFFNQLNGTFREIMEEVYSGHEQIVHHDDLPGSVDIRFFEKETPDSDRLGRMLECIGQFKSKGFDYGDMAIICRKREQCTMAAQFLMEHNIPVVSSESLKVGHSPVVKSLIHWFEYLYNGAGLVPAFRILEYIFGLRYPETAEKELYESWSSGRNLKTILFDLGYSYPETGIYNLTLFEQVNSLMSHFYSFASCDALVTAFLDQVNQFQNKYGNSALDFLDWWRESGLDVTIELPELTDAINIITAHKAKGLEYKIVLAPMVNNEIRISQKSFWVKTKGEDNKVFPIAWLPANKELLNTAYANLYEEEEKAVYLDAINLLYVIMTRARQHLVIFSDNASNSREKNECRLLWESLNLKEMNRAKEHDHFFMGKLTENQKTKQQIQDSYSIEEFESPSSWHDRLMLEFKSECSLNLSDYPTDMERGRIIHELLAGMRDINELNTLLKVLEINEILPKNDCLKLESDISAMLGNDLISKYFRNFKGKVFNEREIIDDQGNRFRPDRCCLNSEEFVLFDYKTGEYNGEHEIQVRKYIELVSEMGYKNCSAYLLYLSVGQIKKVA